MGYECPHIVSYQLVVVFLDVVFKDQKKVVLSQIQCNQFIVNEIIVRALSALTSW